MSLRLKALVVALSLALSGSSAWAECSGQPGAGLLCANPTASNTLPIWATQTSVLDRNFGAPSIQGTVLNRGASLWSATSAPALGLNGTAGGSITLNGATSGSSVINVNAVAGTSTFKLPVGNGTPNQVLITDGSGNTSWTNAGAGTVSSVALALPASILTVSGSPITSTGTLTGTLATQSANLVWAGPTTGAASTPTFRLLVGADLPNPSASTLGGIQSFAAVGSQWIRQISTSGVPTASQPSFTDISGVATGAQLPNPSASTLGGIQSLAAVTSKWINTISTAGVPSATQPQFSDIGGSAVLGQLPSIGSSTVLGNNSGGTAVPGMLTATNILDFIATTQGDILYRNASTWVALAPGTNGQVLTTAGAAANPTWTTVTGTGTVTSVATNNGITGGTITTTGTIGLAAMTAGTVLANVTGGSAVPIANTPSSILDLIGSTTGNLLYRAAGNWTVLAPGTNGQVLTQGATTPSWANAGSVSNVTITASTGLSSSGTCTITTTGTCTIINSGVVTVKKQIFTSSGTYTPSAGLLYTVIEGVGGGGGGGGVSGGTGLSIGAGGGGAGGYSRLVASAATIGASQVITIGTAGTGGAAGSNNGIAGGNSSVGTLLVAKGGAGGFFGSSTQLGAGGAGGVPGTGDITSAGQPGTYGGYNSARASISAIAIPGNGGSSFFGGGAVSTVLSGTVSAAGINASNYGSGGSGAFADAIAANAAGGNGSPGFIIITEYNSQ